MENKNRFANFTASISEQLSQCWIRKKYFKTYHKSVMIACETQVHRIQTFMKKLRTRRGIKAMN